MYNPLKAEILRVFYSKANTNYSEENNMRYTYALDWLKEMEQTALMNHQDDLQKVCCNILWELHSQGFGYNVNN